MPACLILPAPHLPDLNLADFKAPTANAPAINAGLGALDVADLTAGINGFTLGLEDAFKNLNLTLGKIPVIGGELPSVTLPVIDTIEGFRVNLDLALQNLYADVNLPTLDVGAKLQGLLFDVFGPNGLNILMDGPDAGAEIGLSDIYVGSGSDWEQFDFHIGQSFHKDLPLDLSASGGGAELAGALPGLNLDIAANNGIRAEMQWDLFLGLGFTTHLSTAGTGLYFNSGARDNITGDGKPELSAQVNISAAPPKDAAGNDLPSNDPGFQASAQIGLLAGSISDGTARPVQVTSRYAMETNCTDEANPYSASFNLLVTTKSGTTTVPISVSPQSNFASFLLNLNTTVQRKVSDLVNFDTIDLLPISITPRFLPGDQSSSEVAANLIFLARDPGITGLAIQNGDEMGFDSGVQYEDGRSMSLGFTDGQRSNAGAITATLPAPTTGLLAEDTRFSLLIGGKIVPVVLHASEINRHVAGLAPGNYHSDQTSLQEALKVALDHALSQSGFPSYVSTVSLVGGKFTIALQNPGHATPSFSTFVSTTETTGFSITASIDLASPSYKPASYSASDEGTFDRLYFTQLAQAKKNGSMGSVISPKIEADGRIRLHTTLEIATQSVGIGGGSMGMPKVEFDLAWDFSATASYDLGKRAGSKAIQVGNIYFNRVQMDTGAIISTILTPVVGTLGKLVGPLASILDIGKGLFNKDLTIVDWLRDKSTAPNTLAKLVPFGGQVNQLLGILDDIAHFSEKLGKIDLTKPLALGDWEYVTQKIDPTTGQPNPLAGKLVPSEIAASASSASQSLTQFLTAMGSFPGFKFDLLDVSDPANSSIAAMLAGKPFKIMEYGLPDGFHFSNSFGLGVSLLFENPIASTQIDISGSVCLSVDAQQMSLVYDSTGIEEFVSQIRAGKTPKASSLLDGVYLTVPKSGHLIDVGLSMSGSASAIVGLDVQVGSGSISAGMSGDVYLDLLDPVNNDGKLRLNEIFAVTNNFSSPSGIFSLFNVGASLSGNFSFSLDVAGINVDKLLDALGIPTSYSFTVGISTSDIFGNMSKPAAQALSLASEVTENGGKTLYINAGPLASQRKAGDQDDSAGYNVQVSGANRNVSVTLGGKTQTFTGDYRKVVVLGSPGPDTIDLSGLTGLPTEIQGRGGDDIIKGATGGNTIDTGDGNVTVTGGAGGDVITAGAGTATITLGNGSNTVISGSGRLILTDGTGDNTIDASASQYPFVFTAKNGKHTITGSNHGDTITLGTGDNSVIVGAAGATINDGTGKNTIDYRGSLVAAALVVKGTDEVYGSNEDDVVTTASGGVLTYRGGAGDASIIGGSGDDKIYLGDGNNTVVLGGGSNIVVDGLGDDTIDAAANATGFTFAGRGGRDTVRGSAFNDSLSTRSTSGATFYGNAGNDVLTGGIGPDYLDGGLGSDTINAGAGNDTIVTTFAESSLTNAGSGATTFIIDGTTAAGLTVNSSRFFQGSNSFNYRPGDSISVTLGTGNDSVSISGANASITVALGNGANSLTASSINGSLTILGGTGNDTITSLDSLVGPLSLSLGAGTNAVTATNLNGDVAVTAAGTDSVTLGNVVGRLTYQGQNTRNTLNVSRMTGSANVTTAGSTDLFTFSNLTGDLSINSGTGADQTTLSNVSGDIIVVGGDGGNTFTANNVTGDLDLTFGVAIDTVTLTDVQGNVKASLGAGANKLVLTRTTGGTTLNTGGGTDQLTLTDVAGPFLNWTDTGASTSPNIFSLTNSAGIALASTTITTTGKNSVDLTNLTGTLKVATNTGNLTMNATSVKGRVTVDANQNGSGSSTTGTSDSITLNGLSAGFAVTDYAASTSLTALNVAGTSTAVTGTGNDAFSLTSFTDGVTVSAGSGKTTFTGIGLSGATTLTLGGSSPGSVINFSSSSGTFNLTGTESTGGSITTNLDTFTNSVVISLADGNDTLNLKGGTGTLNYSNTGAGIQNAFIGPFNGTATLTLGTGSGSTNQVLDSGLLGTMTVVGGNDANGHPNALLNIDRSGSLSSWTSTLTRKAASTQKIALGSANFTATTLSAIEMDLGDAVDTVNVNGTSDSIPINIYTGAGRDTVTVTSASVSTGIFGAGSSVSNSPGEDTLTLSIPGNPALASFPNLHFNVKNLLVDNHTGSFNSDWTYYASTTDLPAGSHTMDLSAGSHTVVNTAGATNVSLSGGTKTNTLTLQANSSGLSQVLNLTNSIVDLSLASTVLTNPTFASSPQPIGWLSTRAGKDQYLVGTSMPFLTQMTPHSVLKNSDDLVVNLFGANFTQGTQVKVGSDAAVDAVFVNSSWLKVTVSASHLTNSGTVNISLIDSVSQETSGSLPLTVLAGSFGSFPAADTGNGAATGTVDPNWTVVGAGVGPNAYVNGSWIYPSTSSSDTYPTGSFRYVTTIDLTGYDPNSVVIRAGVMVVGSVTGIQLNGVSLGTAPLDGATPTSGTEATATISTGFVPGLNTLAFVVRNTNAKANGLSVALSASTANLVGTERVPGSFLTSPAPTFAPETYSSTLIPSRTFTTGDFDGDGRTDIATITPTSVVTYLAQSNGAFKLSQTFSVSNAVAAAAADLNADGEDDLVVGTTTGIYVAVSTSISNLLVLTGPFQTSLDCSKILLGKFDSDGDVDIWAAPATGSKLSFLGGNGIGGFATATSQTLPVSLASLAAADFNGDGRLDLVAPESSAARIRVYTGLTTGLVSTSGVKTLNVASASESVAVGDVNGDGFADVLAVDPQASTLTTFAGTGTGTFAAGTVLALADNSGADLDGFFLADLMNSGVLSPVIATNGFAEILVNDGAGDFSSPVLRQFEAVGAAGVRPGDVDGDGKIDFISADSSFGVLLNTTADRGPTATVAPAIVSGTGYETSTLSTAATPDLVTAGNFDGGSQDIVTVNEANHTLYFYSGNGDGTFDAPTTKNLNTGVFELYSADLGNNGGRDVVVVRASGIDVYIGDGAGGFGTAKTIPVPIAQFVNGISFTHAQLANLTSGSHADLVATVANSNGSVIGLAYYEGNGDGTFTLTHVSSAFSGNVRDTATGDLDGDGQRDLLLLTSVGLYAYRGSSTGLMSSTTAPTALLFGSFDAVAAADMNADGKVELFLHDTSDGKVYQFNHNYQWSSPSGFTVSSPSSLSVGFTGVSHNPGNSALLTEDFDGDGKIDVAAAGEKSIGIFLNQSNSITSPDIYTTSTNVASLAFNDFDSDGQWDFAAGSSSASKLTLLGSAGRTVALTSLSPATINRGSGSTAVTLTGSGFSTQSVVYWNDQPYAATFVGTTKLQITIPANDLIYPGTARIRVESPAGGVSASKLLTIADVFASSTKTAALNLLVGVPEDELVVGSFTELGGEIAAAEYVASIDWGDGTSSAGFLDPIGGNKYNVVAKDGHVYASAGSKSVVVTLTSIFGGDVKTINSTASVTTPAVSLSAVDFSTNAGSVFTRPVASFTDANPYLDAGSYAATINWGDGTTSTGTVVGRAGAFSVVGTHVYEASAKEAVTVSVTPSGRSKVSDSSVGYVNPALGFLPTEWAGKSVVRHLINDATHAAPRFAAFSPDGLYLAVIDTGNRLTIYQTNITTGSIEFDQLPGLPGDASIAFSPDGNLYILSPSATAVPHYDFGTSGLTFVRNEAIANATAMVMTPDGSRAWFATSDGKIKGFNRNTTTTALTAIETKTQGVGGFDGLAAVSTLIVNTDGDRLFVGSTANGTVAALSINASGKLGFLNVINNSLAGLTSLASYSDPTTTSEYLFVLLPDSDSIAVYGRNADGALGFLQKIREGAAGATGLANPTSFRVLSGGIVQVSSEGDALNAAGLVKYTIATGTPDPTRYHLDFKPSTSAKPFSTLSVNLGAGNDSTTVSSPSVTTLNLVTGSGDDQVLIADTTGGTTITFGDGNANGSDLLTIQRAHGSVTASVSAGTSASPVTFGVVSANAAVTLKGGSAVDTFFVDGRSLTNDVTINALNLTTSPGDVLHVNVGSDTATLSSGTSVPSLPSGNVRDSNSSSKVIYSTMDSVLIDAGPTADAGGTNSIYTLNQGDSLTLSGAQSTIPFGHTATFAWDLNGDGQYDDAVGSTPIIGWDQLTSLGLDSNGAHGIGLLVTTDQGYSDIDFATLQVVSTATFTAVVTTPASSRITGSAIALDLTASDPNPAATAGDWLVNWGDGLIDHYSGNAITANHVYDLNGSYSIQVTATDDNGTTTTLDDFDTDLSPSTIAVSPDTLEIDGATTTVEGDVYTLTLNSSGININFWTVNWGDTTPSSTIGSKTSTTVLDGVLTLTHIYDKAAANRTITSSVTDARLGGSTNLNQIRVNVTQSTPTVTLSGDSSVVENQAYTLTLTGIEKPGVNDAISSWTINWGDGTSAQTVLTSKQTKVVTHVYTGGSTSGTRHVISASATDSDQTVAGDPLSIVVFDNPPVIGLTGGSTATRNSSYSLAINVVPGSDPVTSLTVDWGDNTPSTLPTNATSATHVYAVSGDYRIAVNVTTKDGTFASPSAVLVAVRGVAPTVTIGGPATVSEGDAYALSLSAVQGTESITAWTINWGDGSVSTLNGNPTQATHVYVSEARYAISATASTALASYAASSNVYVEVTDAAPTGVSLTGPASIVEGNAVSISLTAVAGFDPILNYVVNWGEGPSEIVTGTEASHIYRGIGDRTISAAAQTKDGLFAAASTLAVTITAAPPSISVAGTASVDQGVAYVLNLSASLLDGDTLDSWTIDWNDGTAPESLERTALAAGHLYLDGGVAHDIVVTATKTDGAFAVAVTHVMVNDLPPTVTVSGLDNVFEGNSYTLNLNATDIGTGFSERIDSWTIDWGDGIVESIAGNPSSVTHVYADGGAWTRVPVTRIDPVTGLPQTYSDPVATTKHTIHAAAYQGTAATPASPLDVAVLDVAPAIELSAAGPILEGNSFDLMLGAISDPGPDTVTGYSIDWGDGSSESFTGNPSGSSHSHIYADNRFQGSNQRTIYVSLADQDGTHSKAGFAVVTVENVAPTATLSNSDIVYGETLAASLIDAFDPSSADTSAGFHYAFSLDVDTIGSATYANTGNAASASFGVQAAGSHTIYARILDRDGGSTLYVGQVTVAKAVLTVTADSQTKTYDGRPFSGFSARIEGFVNQETASVLRGSASIGGAATTAANAGTYSISPSLGSLAADNYTFNFVDATATIGKAHLTVKATDASKTYDGNDYSGFTAEIVGFVNQEGVEVVTGDAGFVGNAVGAVDAGSYVITPTLGSLDALNYDFSTFIDGVLTIDQAASVTKAIGDIFTYDGTTHAGGLSTVTGVGSLTGSAVLSYVGDRVNAGTYTVIATYAGDRNHLGSSDSATITILRAQAGVSVTGASGTYDATRHSASALVTGVGGTSIDPLGTTFAYYTASDVNFSTPLAAAPMDAGDYVVVASYPGSANYLPATASPVPFTIAKAPLKVAVASLSMTFGSSLPTLTGVVSGILANDEVTVSYATTATSASHAGAYPITASISGSRAFNYVLILGSGYAPGLLTILQATPVVVVNAPGSTYNGLPYSAETTTVTGVGGESLDPGDVTYKFYNASDVQLSAPLASAPSDAGAYVVVATYPGSTNYESSSDWSTFMIARRQTVTSISVMNPRLAPGEAATFFVYVDGELGMGNTPTGAIQFRVDGVDFGQPVPVSSSGTATLTTTALSSGSHSITAVYSGDGNFFGSTSAAGTALVLAPGATVSGTVLYVVGTNSADVVQINAIGASVTGSTGVQVNGTFNGVYSSKSFSQTLTAIVVYGYDGNDNIQLSSSLSIPATINEGNGNDYIKTGNGNDVINLGTGSSQVFGGDGNKTITAHDLVGSSLYISLGNGNAMIVLGDGTDQVVLGNGVSYVQAGDGADSVKVGNGNTTIKLGNGNDYVKAGNGNNIVTLGNGSNKVQLGNGNNTVTGGNGSTYLSSGNGANVVTLGNGANNIQLGNGDNSIVGGNGSTYVSSGNGRNIVTLGNGVDNVQLGNGDNTVVLGDGNDYVTSGNGNNTVTVGNGNDNIQLGNGDNVIVEGSGSDYVKAGNGANLVVAGLGGHTVQLGNGPNILIDGAASVATAGDSLRTILNDWKAGNAAGNRVNTRIRVTYNSVHPSFMYAGNGRNWFFVTSSATKTNAKSTDRIN